MHIHHIIYLLRAYINSEFIKHMLFILHGMALNAKILDWFFLVNLNQHTKVKRRLFWSFLCYISYKLVNLPVLIALLQIYFREILFINLIIYIYIHIHYSSTRVVLIILRLSFSIIYIKCILIFERRENNSEYIKMKENVIELFNFYTNKCDTI